MKKNYFLFIFLLFLFGTKNFLYSKSFRDVKREAFGQKSSEENNQSDAENLDEKITDAVQLKEVKKLSQEQQQKELEKVKKMFFARKTAEIRKRYAEAVLPRYVYAGNYAVVKFLLEKTSLDLKTIDKEGGNILIPAIWTENIELVKILLNKGADVNGKGNYIYIGKNSTNTYSIPIILTAMFSLELTKILKKKGAKIEAKNKYEYTALMVAAYKGHLEVVKYLVESGAKIESKNKYENTALMSAAIGGHLEVFKYLVSKGADTTRFKQCTWNDEAIEKYKNSLK